MWRPEPMRHVLVLLPEADLDRVARAVVETGLLHPTPLGAGDGGETGLRLPDVSGRLSELDRVLRDLEEAGNVLSALLPPDSLPTTPPMTEGPEPGFGAAERQRADEIIARVEDLQARELHLREECEKIEHAALGLRAWIQAGLPPGLGRELRHFDVVAGTIPAAQRAAFGRRLELVPDVASFFAQDPGSDGRVLVVVAARKGGGAALDEVFQAADFERVQSGFGRSARPARRRGAKRGVSRRRSFPSWWRCVAAPPSNEPSWRRRRTPVGQTGWPCWPGGFLPTRASDWRVPCETAARDAAS